jgi:2-iminobutanoate/2-iminopropanoate deaminase
MQDNSRATKAAKRQTYRLPGLSSSDMAPDLTRVDNMFFTSGVRGVDLNSGALAETPAHQFELAWRNLGTLLESAGFSADSIGFVTCFIGDQQYRDIIGPGWAELFPDEGDRPARKTTSYSLPAGEAVELQAFGVIGPKRERIDLPGFTHREPIPNGVRMGDTVFSSVLTRNVDGPEAGTDQCFENMQRFMELAGGGAEDVVLQWVYLNDMQFQSYMVDVYLKSWPIGGYQAARKTFEYAMGGQIQMQVIGKLGGERRNLEIPGFGHHDPIPAAARIGNLICSSGVAGRDPSNPGTMEAPEGVVAQSTNSLANIKTLVEEGGGTLDDIGHMTLMVQDYDDLPAINAEWERVFPDVNNRPALQVMKMGIKGRGRVQSHMIALV